MLRKPPVGRSMLQVLLLNKGGSNIPQKKWLKIRIGCGDLEIHIGDVTDNPPLVFPGFVQTHNAICVSTRENVSVMSISRGCSFRLLVW